MKYLSGALIFSATLIISACGAEGVPTEQESEALLGAANPTTDTSQTPQAETTTGGTNTDGEIEQVAISVPASAAIDNETTIAATTTAPVIRFTGTTFDKEQEIGDVILLDGSDSTIAEGEITNFQWRQPSNGQPLVELINANSATASFIATADINSQPLQFELTVTGSNGEKSRSKFYFTWSVEALSIEEPVTETTLEPEIGTEIDEGGESGVGTGAVTETQPRPEPEFVGIGSYALDESGDFFAKSLNSVFLADQTLNRIIHLDAQNDIEIETFQLIDKPTFMAYIAPTDTLYVAFKTAGKLAKINLATGDVSFILIDQPALSLVAYNDRVFYTSKESPGSLNIDKPLYSIGDDGQPTLHGTVRADLIEINPVNGEIYTATTKSSPATIFRYAIDSLGTVSELQSLSTKFDGLARDLSVSPNGEQLAVSTTSSYFYGWGIPDVSTSDLNTTNGAWFTGLQPGSGEFSGSGTLFASTNESDLMVFDANRHTLLETYEIDQNICFLSDSAIEIVRFSADSKAVFARQVCGNNDEKSVLFFATVPELAEPVPAPVIPAPAQASLNKLEFKTVDIGDVYAESINSVYLADRRNNRIVHVDVDAGAELNYFELDAQPSQFAYVESTNSLYVSFFMAEKLVKINLDTGEQTEIRIESNGLSLLSYDERVYFVTYYKDHLSFRYHQLNSIGSDDIPVFHGDIESSQININPVNGEIVVGSYLGIQRYALDSLGMLESIQNSVALGGARWDFSISPDGKQLAVILSDNDDVVHDLDAMNPVIANGAWESSPFELKTFEFSGSGAIFAATNHSQVMLYDPISHVLTSTIDLGEDNCEVGGNFSTGSITDIGFTEDDLHIVTTIECANEEKMLVVLRPVP